MNQIHIPYISPHFKHYDKLGQLINSFTSRVKGRMADDSKRRKRFSEILNRIAELQTVQYDSGPMAKHAEFQAYQARNTRKALGLAKMANRYFDEHGSSRGDYRTTKALDYIPPAQANSAPYFDMGRGGLGLIEITRRRVYAKSSKWYPKSTTARFLVGRNEAGTFFAHAVPASCSSVYAAVQWIWNGQANNIIRRQGDIAVARGRSRKLPTLPAGHRVDDGHVTHATHPTIALPGPGEYLIVGRRATPKASVETRD